MTIETKANGYTADGIQKMIHIFETAVNSIFPDSTVRHFYYGDHLDMADIIFPDKHYAHFNVTAKRVSLSGYSLTNEQLRECGNLTFNDELYNGKLIDIAEQATA